MIYNPAFQPSMPAPTAHPEHRLPKDPRPLSLTEVMAVILISYLVFLAFLLYVGGPYWSLVNGGFGDNPAYLEAASAIRHWQFNGVEVKQFWGLSYAVACVSIITGLSLPASMVLVCVGASLSAVALFYRIWDGWIAVLVALLSLDWFQRSLLGGAEPLLMALLFGAFLMLRRDRWVAAAVLGSLATVVRPFGVFALVGLGIELLYRRRFRDCAIATAIALAIGALYTWPLKHYLGNAFANVTTYQRNDWHAGFPFQFPFVAIIRDTFPIESPLTNLALTYGWILFVLIGVAVALRSGDFQEYARKHTAEAVFVTLYCLAIYTYEAPGWSRAEFPRFALPLLPFTLFFLRKYLPKKRSVVWTLALITPAVAAASALGIRQTAAILLRRFH